MSKPQPNQQQPMATEIQGMSTKGNSFLRVQNL
jgi:hypothetical protein